MSQMDTASFCKTSNFRFPLPGAKRTFLMAPRWLEFKLRDAFPWNYV